MKAAASKCTMNKLLFKLQLKFIGELIQQNGYHAQRLCRYHKKLFPWWSVTSLRLVALPLLVARKLGTYKGQLKSTVVICSTSQNMSIH